MKVGLDDVPWRTVAVGALSVTIAASALAAGGWKLEILPFVALIAFLALTAAAIGAIERGHRPRVPKVSVVLAGLALFTLAQAIALPEVVLGLLSPKANDLRTFVAGTGAGPISYEPAATLREAGKLLTYAIVVWTAFLLAGRSSSRMRTLQTIVAVGLISAATAIIHRALGVRRLFGWWETTTPTAEMLTTFVNPNHAAGFMVLCSVTALGLGDASVERSTRTGWRLTAVVCGGVSIFLLSKGGIAGLALALALYFSIRRWDWLRSPRATIGVIAATVAVGSTLWLVWKDTLLDERHPWGAAIKVAGVRDVVPMVWDHPVFGIGRGAFVSVYPQYKTSPLQLTFAFPENLVAQLVAEWGLIVGLAATVGLIAVIARRLGGNDPAAIGAMSGVAAVVAQNSVDFSLELAGMAVPVAAIIGTYSTPAESWTLASRRRLRVVTATLAVGALALIGTFAGAFGAGDLDLDLKRLVRMVRRASEARAESAPGPKAIEASEFEPVWARHPANPLVSAQVAYLREIGSPPDFARALKAANRTLYLAPMYADGHLLTGRLLLRTGHRQQGLSSIRQAWAISAGRRDLINHGLSLCRTVDDVWQLLPRADILTDRPDGRSIALAAKQLRAAGRDDLANAVMARPYADDEATPDEIAALAGARMRAGLFESALAAIRRLRKERPNEASLAIDEARTLLRLQRWREALDALSSLRIDTDPEVERLRFQAALRADALDTAAEALQRLERKPGSARAQLPLLEARLLMRRGEPARALERLNQALERNPIQIDVRLLRAQLLMKQKRFTEAELDVRLILRRAPKHRTARRMAQSLNLDLSSEPR